MKTYKSFFGLKGIFNFWGRCTLFIVSSSVLYISIKFSLELVDSFYTFIPSLVMGGCFSVLGIILSFRKYEDDL